jgi:soluble lytic murein transglycosylase-like protein
MPIIILIVLIAGIATLAGMPQAPASDPATDSPDTSGDTVTAGDETASPDDPVYAPTYSNDVYQIYGNETMNAWPANSDAYQSLITDSANANGIPVMILAWLLWKESRYNPAIIDGSHRSPVGALGIAQFMPATAIQELGSTDAALDPSIAIPGAARYLAKCFKWTGSSTWQRALAAYNWGAGNVQKKGTVNAPAETRDYYTTILANAGFATTA